MLPRVMSRGRSDLAQACAGLAAVDGEATSSTLSLELIHIFPPIVRYGGTDVAIA